MIKKNKKIIWIAHEGNKSGANNALLQYAENLNRNDYEITIIIPSSGTMVNGCITAGLKVKKIPFYSWVHGPNYLSTKSWVIKRGRNFVSFFSAFHFIIKQDPNIIITNSVANPPFFAIIAKILRIRHIWFLQEFGDLDHGCKFDWGSKTSKFIINHFSDKVIVVSNAVKKHFSSHIANDKMVVIFNRVRVPINYEGKGPAKPQRPFRILHLAQISPGKNQEESIKAVKILINEGLDVELHMLGSITNKEYYSKLEILLNNSKIQKRIFLGGFSTEPYQEMSNSHVVVLCSRCEACALTIFETMKIGTPIIVSNTGGNIEIVNNGETGLVYELGSPSDLALKLKSLYNSNDYGNYLSNNAQKFSDENYKIDHSLLALKKILVN